MATKIRSPVGRDTWLFAFARNQTTERAKRGFPVDPVLFPDASISDNCAAPLGLWLRVLPYPRAPAHGLTHAAPLALELQLDQQPSFPRFHPNQLIPKFKMTHYSVN